MDIDPAYQFETRIVHGFVLLAEGIPQKKE